MPDLVFHFLQCEFEVMSLSTDFPAGMWARGSVRGYLSLLSLSGMSLPLSFPPFLSTSELGMVLLWMSRLMKDPSSVINIFPGPGIVCGFNYHSGAHLLFRWHAPAKWRFISSTMCVSAHQLCRWQQLHIYVF